LGRRKETFVRLRSSASPGDRALATRGLRACFFSAVGPQEPSAPVGVLTSRHKKELRNTLATAVPRSPIFFGLPGTASSRQRLFCGTGLSPPSPSPLLVRPFRALVLTAPGLAPLALGTCACDCAASASPIPSIVRNRPTSRRGRVGCGGICLPAPYASSGARVSPPRIPGVARVGTRCSPDTPPEPQINEMLSW